MAKRSARTKRAARPSRAASKRTRDVALILHPTDDNEGFQILRQRAADSPVELGTLRPLREGRPIDGEVVSLHPRKDMPLLCDVNVELADTRRGTSDGPAQVATDDYRRGWDAIWGRTPAGRPN
jgi:hypothetical protein